MRWIALLLLCLGAPATAAPVQAPESGELVPLDAAWVTRATSERSEAMADPALDDTSWPTLAIWQQTEAASSPQAPTYIWHRASVAVPAGPVSQALAIVCKNSDVAVWVDGVRQEGGCGADAMPVTTPGRDLLQVPLEPGLHMVAVRTGWSPRQSVNLRRFAHWVELRGRVGPSSAVNAWSQTQLAELAGQAAVQLVMAALFLGFAVFHGLVWIRRPKMRSYLWFSLSAAAVSLWQLEAVGVLLQGPYAWHAGWAVSHSFMWTWIGNGALMAFIWWYVRRRPPNTGHRVVVYSAFALGLVKLVPGAFALHIALLDVERVGLLALLIYGLAVLIVAAVRRRPGALVMLTAFVPGAAFLSLQVAGVVSAVQLGTVVFPSASLGVMLVMGGVATALALRFASTLAEVDQRNAQLVTINASIRRFVPEAFLEQLGRRSIIDVQRGDQVERDMAVLFADIRGFTGISEGLSPKENFELVNDYLGRMEPSIRTSGGFIDKFIGDAIMALFPGAPDARPGQQAVDAAIGMQLALLRFNADRAQLGLDPLQVGIGAHVGALMLGTVGGEDRLDGTVISDAVNLAARMEGLTKLYGARLLVTDQVLADVAEPKPRHREVDLVAVKGRAGTARIWEVMEVDDEATLARKMATRDALRQAIAAFRGQQWDLALGALASMELHGPDPVIALYRSRIAELQRTPPGPEWDGAMRMSTK